MGLFQKNKASENHSDDLPKYVDTLLEDTHQSTDEEIDERFSVNGMSLSQKYGIDHAVALMRELPNENSSVIVSVVTKTLGSANINVTDIIDDAKAKETTLHAQIKQLNEEIAALEAQIAEKKEQINVSTAILEETCKVRAMLEKAEQTDAIRPVAGKSSQPAAKKDQPAKKEEVLKMEPVAKLAIEAV
jgi:cell division protein FtsB